MRKPAMCGNQRSILLEEPKYDGYFCANRYFSQLKPTAMAARESVIRRTLEIPHVDMSEIMLFIWGKKSGENLNIQMFGKIPTPINAVPIYRVLMSETAQGANPTIPVNN